MFVFRMAAFLVAVLLCSSCGPSGPTLHPVTGKVLFEDQPAVGANVVFHPQGGAADAPKPAGVVGADGTFTLNTYPHGVGAPEGEYHVAITWFAPAKNENAEPKTRIDEKYSNSSQSGLRATVKAGTNTLEPFKVQKRLK